MDSLFSATHIALSVAIFVVVATVKKLAHPVFDTHPVGIRVLPVMPLVLGVAAALLGFVDDGITRLPDRIVVGVLCAAFSSQAYKLAKTTILGRGLPGLSSPSEPPSPPTVAAEPPAADTTTSPSTDGEADTKVG